MSLILRQVIGYQQGRKTVSTTANPLLKKELDQVKKDLNAILTEWNWSGVHPKTSQEFLTKFKPWVNEKIELDKELKVFLAKKGLTNLQEADTKLTNQDLSENEELNQLRQELTNLKKELAEKATLWKNTEEDYLARIEELLRTKSTGENKELKDFLKLYSVNSLEQLKDQWNNTEEDYLKQIQDLKENRAVPEDYEELITERDQLARDKNELQQEVLSLNNKLKLKHQEVTSKEKTIETLKKDKDQQEVNLNKKITEKNGLITTLQREVNQLKEKYSKKSKQLDEEQLENNKLTEEIEKLQAEIKELTT